MSHLLTLLSRFSFFSIRISLICKRLGATSDRLPTSLLPPGETLGRQNAVDSLTSTTWTLAGKLSGMDDEREHRELVPAPCASPS